MPRSSRFVLVRPSNPVARWNRFAAQVMKARGWKQTADDDWDFMYADVGWIHENITYGNVRSQNDPGTTYNQCVCKI